MPSMMPRRSALRYSPSHLQSLVFGHPFLMSGPRTTHTALPRSELVQGIQPCVHPTPLCFSALASVESSSFFLQASVVLIPSTLHAHKLWGALLLQIANLKPRGLIMGINLYTAFIISSHAHSLCDHGTHQSATSAHIHAVQASTFAAE